MNLIKLHTLLIGASFFMIATSACNLINHDHKIDPEKEGIYEGIYFQGIEDSKFVPCADNDESWLPRFESESFDRVWEVLAESESYRVLMKAKGIPSKKENTKAFSLYTTDSSKLKKS